MSMGILGIPVPDETILTFIGYLISQNKLAFLPSLISAFIGSAIGTSISFLIGNKYGYQIILKHKKFFHIDENKIIKTQKWFNTLGKWLLMFGYFVPGFRHLTALIAGSSKVKFSLFAKYAFAGALVWSTTFLIIGINVGKQWQSLIFYVHQNIILAFLLIALIIVFVLILINYFQKK